MSESNSHIFPASFVELDAMEKAAAEIGDEEVRVLAAALRDSWAAREHGRSMIAASPLDRDGNWYAEDGTKILFEELLPPGTRVPAADLGRMMQCARPYHIDEKRKTLSLNDALLCLCPRQGCGAKHLVIECRGRPHPRGPYLKWRVVFCAQRNRAEVLPLRTSSRYGSWEEMRADDSQKKAVSLEERASRR